MLRVLHRQNVGDLPPFHLAFTTKAIDKFASYAPKKRDVFDVLQLFQRSVVLLAHLSENCVLKQVQHSSSLGRTLPFHLQRERRELLDGTFERTFPTVVDVLGDRVLDHDIVLPFQVLEVTDH
jgi:hypothetical protein